LKNGDGTLGSYQYGNQNEKGDIGKGRSDTFTVTPEQSEEIVSIGNGFIDIWFVATTTNAHRDIPNVTITKPDTKEDVFNGKPQVIQGRLMRLDACGNKVLELGTDSTVPNIDGYISQIVEERRNMITKESKGIFASIFRKGKLDGKSILLERSENMLKEMSDLLYYIYSQLSGEYRKQYDEYYKIPKNKNKTIIWSDFKPLSDEMRTDLTEKLNTYFFTFQKQIDDSGDEENPMPSFRRVVPGEYSDRTINKGNLYGDIRLDLNKFYDGYDLLYSTSKGPKYGKYPLNTGQNWTSLLANIKKLKQWAFTV
jgi:hypothetical protein